MQSAKKDSSGMWGTIRIVSLAVLLLGVIVGAYSGYTLFSGQPGFHGYVGFNRSGFNSTGINQSGFNQTGFNQSVISTNTERFRGGIGFTGGLSGLVIGVLLIILGVVTYKYSELQISVMSKK